MKVITIQRPTDIEIEDLKKAAKVKYGNALIDLNETNYGETVSLYLRDEKPESSFVDKGDSMTNDFRQFADQQVTVAEPIELPRLAELTPEQQSTLLQIAFQRLGLVDGSGHVLISLDMLDSLIQSPKVTDAKNPASY